MAGWAVSYIRFNVHSEMWWKMIQNLTSAHFFRWLGVEKPPPKINGANPGWAGVGRPVLLFEVQKSGSLSSKSFEDPGNNLQPLRLKPKDAEYLQVTGLEGPGFLRYWSRVQVLGGEKNQGKKLMGNQHVFWIVWKHFFLSLFPKSIKLGILLESCWFHW